SFPTRRSSDLGQFRGLRSDGVADRQPGQRILAVDLSHLTVEEELELLVRAGAVLHGLGSSQFLTAVDERDLRRETGEERGFLECRVATADDGDVLVTEEESITGGAPAHAVTGQLLLIGQTELAVGRTGRQDHCL